MIVVTGGAGFIGSNILAGLQDRGIRDLAVIDRFGCGEKWRNLAKRDLGFMVTPENTWDFLTLHHSEIEIVIHMGGISSTTEDNVDLIVANNYALTMKLWRYCAEYGKRFVYASSAAVYGAGEHGFKDDDSLEYLNLISPLNAYGWSKIMVDRTIAMEVTMGKRRPMQYVGLRFFNVYGPNEYHKKGQKSVIAHIYPDVVADRQVELFKSYHPQYADGGQRRDFVWVGDIISVVMWFLDHPKVSGLFNVGSGKARSFYDLAMAVWTAAGKSPKIGYKEMPESLRERYQYFTEADLSKLRTVGYNRDMTSLEDGVNEYVCKYLSCRKDPYR